MSKNVLVSGSDGTSRVVANVSHIITELQSGDTCVWVPKDEVEANGSAMLVFDDDQYKTVLLVPDGDSMAF